MAVFDRVTSGHLATAFLHNAGLLTNNKTLVADALGLFGVENGAASVIRTRDLTLTKGALYRWSYGSIIPIFRFSGIVHYRRNPAACHRNTWAVTSSLVET